MTPEQSARRAGEAVRDPSKLAAALERTLGPDSTTPEDPGLQEVRRLLPRLRAAEVNDRDVSTLVFFGLRQGLERLLESHGLPIPPFNLHRGFWENFYGGPPEDDFVPRNLTKRPVKLADVEIGFPFGVPSCALTPNHEFVRFFAERGFDLITYKTVRDKPRDAHEFPHWAFVQDVKNPLSEENLDDPVVATLDTWPDNASQISMVNSFGVPSLPPADWQQDIEDSKNALGTGQALVVSVMGTPEDAASDTELIEQFVSVAAKARDAGADIVELNMSCPNTGGELMFLTPELASLVCRAVSAELKRTSTPTFIKIGYLTDRPLERLIAMCAPHINGIVAINTVQVPVTNLHGMRFFSGPADRQRAGISGFAVKELGLRTARSLARLREENHYDYSLIGVGGVTSPADFDEYMNAGVDAVQSCTGSWINPMLAQHIRGIDPSEAENDSTLEELDPTIFDIGPLPGTGLPDPFGRVGVKW